VNGRSTTDWLRWARAMPSWVLVAELGRRRGLREPTAVSLPGLVVDPLAGLLVRDGVEHALGGRRMEVVYALAQEAARGKRRVGTDYLARRVFWDHPLPCAAANLRTYVHYLNRELPGLLATPGTDHRVGTGYGLHPSHLPQETSA